MSGAGSRSRASVRSSTKPPSEDDAEGVTRWTQEPFAWLVFALPLAAVLGCAVTIALAITSRDGMVTDDYYRRGMEINRSLAREAEAARLGIGIRATNLTPEGLRVVLEHPAETSLPDALPASLYYATRAGLDREVTLTRQPSGHYTAAVPALAAGHWNLEIATDGWRVVSRLRVH